VSRLGPTLACSAIRYNPCKFRRSKVTGCVLLQAVDTSNAVHPGQYVRESVLNPKKLSVSNATKLVGVGRPAFSNFLNGHVAFGIPAQRLLDMQARKPSRPAVNEGRARGQHEDGEGARRTKEVPIVMLPAADPISAGFVKTLARPGGNITGVTSATAELAGKSVQIMRELVPSVKRITALLNIADPFNKPFFEQVELSAKALGIKVSPIRIRAEELPAALAPIAKDRPDALIIQPSLPTTTAAFAVPPLPRLCLETLASSSFTARTRRTTRARPRLTSTAS
jgi:hypothetical protein